jgi:NADH dehydrogenase/NADH:ubiquinone oxidoreductase subunit G
MLKKVLNLSSALLLVLLFMLIIAFFTSCDESKPVESNIDQCTYEEIKHVVENEILAQDATNSFLYYQNNFKNIVIGYDSYLKEIRNCRVYWNDTIFYPKEIIENAKKEIEKLKPLLSECEVNNNNIKKDPKYSEIEYQIAIQKTNAILRRANSILHSDISYRMDRHKEIINKPYKIKKHEYKVIFNKKQRKELEKIYKVRMKEHIKDVAKKEKEFNEKLKKEISEKVCK